ncbi:MAG: 4-aminobutyrate--2-oxoglutarate transaminase [Burkholderiales bacterium]|nr:4-aminobutyrate--2-oxoglutarate transaminase [Burkholderiales bacterium]
MELNDLKNANAALEQRRQAATARGVGVLSNFYVARAENSELWDVEGRRFIDFAGGIAVVNVGHRHPKVIAAVKRQLDEGFIHTCYQVVPYEGYVSLAEKLNTLVPISGPKKTNFFSTGAEAIENIVKIARVATGRSGIIAFGGAFHGRSIMASALTGKVSPYKLGFGPFPPEVFHAPFPCRDVGVQQALDGLEQIFRTEIEPKRVAAMIIEPVQGEGGFYDTPPEFMRALRKLCDDNGILLVADEIQTGFGRTGTWFAMEQYGVEPDLMTIAKSLAAGFPLSAVTGRAAIMDAAAPGGLGGTYAGNPVAIAAAHAVIDVFHEEKLLDRSKQLGARLKARLVSQRQRFAQIADVRGLGSMVAVEFNHPGTSTPDAAFAKRVQQEAMQRGLILLTCGVGYNVIRFLYPLTVQDTVFEEALKIVDASLAAAG